MCGRYTNHASWAEVLAFTAPLAVATPEADPEPAYNIAPSQRAWVIVDRDGEARAERMRWGLLPAWARDAKVGYSTFNARIETADTKPAFRAAWKTRRCLVVATGYYEWREEDGLKQPYWIHPHGGLMLFGGLWERNAHVAAEPVDSFSILTCPAEGPIEQLHARMPLSLQPTVLHDWLMDSPAHAGAIATAAPPVPVRFHRVRREVGNPRSQGEGLIARAD